jgi:salicylate hydroxylase
MDADIIIVGAGIAGLACALSIARRSPTKRLLVLEQAEQFSEVGAGIQLGPNAWRALTKIGGETLYSAIERQTSFAKSVEVHDAVSNSILRQGRVDDCTRIYGHPFGSIHRAHLHNALLQACQAESSITLQANAALANFSVPANSTEPLTVRLTGGQALSAFALLGCDGVRSAVRAQLWPQANAYNTNLITVRALFDTAQLPPALVAIGQAEKILMWWGPKMHVVLYNVSGGKQMNMVGFTQAPDTEAALCNLAAGFATTPVAPLFKDAQAFSPWPMWHQPRLARWSQGPVSLAGDAAHASMPFLAQGAGMALEDAAVLGQCTASHRDAALAFATYEQLRYARSMRAQRQSGLMQWVDHASGPLRLGRNLVMRMMRHQHVFAPIAWLYRDPNTK